MITTIDGAYCRDIQYARVEDKTMTDEPIRYLSLAAIARRADRSPQTTKRKLLAAGISADALELPSTTFLFREDKVAELVKLLAAEPEPAALNSEPTTLA